jgi:hypothetical protein
MDMNKEKNKKRQHLMTLDWDDLDKQKLAKAFTLIDEVLFKCEMFKKEREAKELANIRNELHEIVISFSLLSLIDEC